MGETINKIKKASSQLLHENGHEPSIEEIAKVVRAGINTIVIPLTIPGTESGSIIFLYTIGLLAPRSYAASMILLSIFAFG